MSMEKTDEVPPSAGGCSLEPLVRRLEAIAKKNRDEFGYRIEVDVDRSGTISYRFVAIETADRHEFVTGYGKTIDEAAETAMKDVEEACELWSYKVA